MQFHLKVQRQVSFLVWRVFLWNFIWLILISFVSELSRIWIHTTEGISGIDKQTLERKIYETGFIFKKIEDVTKCQNDYPHEWCPNDHAAPSCLKHKSTEVSIKQAGGHCAYFDLIMLRAC